MNLLTQSAFTLSTLLLVFSAQANNSGQYQIDPTHSKIGFEIPHLVISSVEGSFNQFRGTIDLNEQRFSRSKVNASIDVKSISTGVKKRDNHLLSKDFFEATKYPKMTFKSHKIKGNKSKFKLTGDLTIKDKKRRVTFDGKFLGTVKDGYGNLKAAFVLTTTINRKDYGLTWGSVVEAGPVVGDDVKITLKIQAARPIVKKQASN